MTQTFMVRLVLDAANRSWIIGKIADELAQHLPRLGVAVDISEHPSPQADINHWMVYHYPWGYYTSGLAGKRTTKSTMLITHVDDAIKLRMLKETLNEVVDVGICMSRMTVDQLARSGIERRQLCFILPAHNGRVSPRRIVIGITTKVFSDNRKRENLLVELAQAMRLDAFHFEIVGKGWDSIVPHLESAGATVRYYAGTENHRQDYEVLLQRIPTFDYYLYAGLDEGSMGTLDALASGVPTIITPQGFHLDIENGITHPFWDGAELRGIFGKLAQDRNARIEGVRHLTWDEYARQHAIVWRALLEGRQNQITSLLPQSGGQSNTRSRHTLSSRLRLYRNVVHSDFFRHYGYRWIEKSKVRLFLYGLVPRFWKNK